MPAMKYFTVYYRQDLMQHTRIRRFETKTGERIRALTKEGNWQQALQDSPARFVLLGIPEDIGVKANYGTGGTDTVWWNFLDNFLNQQSNHFLNEEDILLLGHFDFSETERLISSLSAHDEEKLLAMRKAVAIIDNAVEDLIRLITSVGKIPVVIGGGHNNAYPLLKGSTKGLRKFFKKDSLVLNCINLDAHTDLRPLEGRHSGNGFSYAMDEGYLKQYAMLATFENYVPQNVLRMVNDNEACKLFTFEDIFVRQKLDFMQAVYQAVSFTEGSATGIEVDLDVIQNTLSLSLIHI